MPWGHILSGKKFAKLEAKKTENAGPGPGLSAEGQALKPDPEDFLLCLWGFAEAVVGLRRPFKTPRWDPAETPLIPQNKPLKILIKNSKNLKNFSISKKIKIIFQKFVAVCTGMHTPRHVACVLPGVHSVKTGAWLGSLQIIQKATRGSRSVAYISGGRAPKRGVGDIVGHKPAEVCGWRGQQSMRPPSAAHYWQRRGRGGRRHRDRPSGCRGGWSSKAQLHNTREGGVDGMHDTIA